MLNGSMHAEIIAVAVVDILILNILSSVVQKYLF